MSKIYCFRHAQASYLSDNYDQLSDKGIEQSRALGEYLVQRNIVFDKTYVGPLVRQRHTTDLVSERYKSHGIHFPEAKTVDALVEHQGPKALKKALPNLRKSVPKLQQWHAEIEADPGLKRKNSLLTFEYFISEWVEGNINVPDIEPWMEFRQKVRKGLKNILSEIERGENVAIFTSGGTISAIIGEILKLENQRQIAALNFNVFNTSFTTILHSKSRLSLLSFNEVPHLQEELITFV